ncbi:hypothetical protein FOE78_01885 [Microlunatus elymi]|uniref:Zinc-ribbon domain-containing protein n=1 Tax=Microlunatus elymi TaxID=2596828 RepID=A0A516PUG6_9ACTN|nr:zinc-ribbon domain-containing protein [Microlunatus elymi]QDP94834.1 hypothetical protein FOE78_01885 [Microlunatus elymi]
MPDQLICPQCGTANPPTARFCAECGWAPSPEADRTSATASTRRRPRAGMLAAIIAGTAAVVVLVIVVITQTTRVGNGARIAATPVQKVGSSPGATATGRASGGPAGTDPADTGPAGSGPAADRSGTAAPDFGPIAERMRSGVLGVFATGCGDGTRVGSAFLVGRQTAVTSYAALVGAKAVAVTAGDRTISATIRSADPSHGVVVLKLGHPVDGQVFSLADRPLREGEDTAVLGVEVGSATAHPTSARIAATDLTTLVGSTEVSGLAAIDTGYHPGWTGAPTLAADGSASGMMLAGPQRGTVVPAAAIKAALDGHEPLPSQHCAGPVSGPATTKINGTSNAAVEQLLSSYFGAINGVDYSTAYAQLGPGSKPAGSGAEQFFQGWSTSYDFNITVHSASRQQAHVSFDSVFAPGHGPEPSITCARWDIDYRFTSHNGGLLINKASPHSGRIWHHC